MSLRKSLAPIAKTLVFTVLVPGTVLVYVPWRIRFAGGGEDLPLGMRRWLGLPLLLAGTIGYFWCAFDFATVGRGTPLPLDPPKRLVVRGLYRHVRNPMYLSVLLVAFGEAFLFCSSALFWYAAAVFLFFSFFVLLYEEPALARKFGQDYERYRGRVRRWIPRLQRYREDGLEAPNEKQE